MEFNDWTDDDGSRVCQSCGENFVLWHHERKFFEAKGLQLPKRCKSCRQERRKARDANVSTWA